MHLTLSERAFKRELDAPHTYVAEHVARYTDDEQVVEPLTEEHLQRNAHVGTAHNHRER